MTIDEPVVIVDYDERWPEAFRREQDRLRAALGAEVAIDHIGSTAVSGCRAKPVIDIQVAAPRQEMAHVAAVVADAGYESFADPNVRDRVYLRRRSAAGQFNVQVVAAESDLPRDNLALRTYLRTHPEEAVRYGRAKDEAVAAAPRLLDYSHAKAAIVRELVESAREWARRRA